MEEQTFSSPGKPKGFLSETPPKISFLLGLLAGVVIAVIIGYFVGVPGSGSASGSGSAAKTADSGDKAAPSAPAPTKADLTVTDKDHIRGNKDAKVTMIEYSDFECPFCSRHLPTIEQALKDYEGKVRLIYRHFPLSSIHPNAQKAAEASECAGEQGKFWEMHDKLFELASSKQLSVGNYKKEAGNMGLNQGQFDSCLDDGKFAQHVKDDQASGSAAGVRGTPATFINGEMVSGAIPFDTLKAAIEKNL